MIIMQEQDNKDTQEQGKNASEYVTKEEFKQLQEQITGVQIKAKNQSRSLEEKLAEQGGNISKILEALSTPKGEEQIPEGSEMNGEQPGNAPSLEEKIELFQQKQQKAFEQQSEQILSLQKQLDESKKETEKSKKEAILARQKTSWLNASQNIALNPDMMYELVKAQGDIITDIDEVVVNTGEYDTQANEIYLRGSEAVKHLLALPQYSNFAITSKPSPGSGHIPGANNTPTKTIKTVTLENELQSVFGGVKI